MLKTEGTKNAQIREAKLGTFTFTNTFNIKKLLKITNGQLYHPQGVTVSIKVFVPPIKCRIRNRPTYPTKARIKNSRLIFQCNARYKRTNR